MIQTGFETRVKVQQIVDTHLPSFILDENPKAPEFLKQYYISQEFQGGPIDIAENLDQYLKPDNLIQDIIVDSASLILDIESNDSTINVSSTKGFPDRYGLLKIDDEIITYTTKTANSFIGCIRGFSGITNYHQELNSEELVFTETTASSHKRNTTIQNLSSLFFKEFFAKLKKTFLPGFEELPFSDGINVGNFIKEARTFYESKGTNESFRILFNVLYGVTPKVINLEQYLIKPSSANYIRREIVLVDIISGSNALNLKGQTIYKTTDSSVSASVSEVEPFTRDGVEYFKLSLFIGYTDSPNIQGEFKITPKTKSLEKILSTDTIITVDSTIGFEQTGTITSGSNTISYTSKSINQFFGCTGINSPINVADDIISTETYYGYENGDTTKKVEFSINGSLSDFIQTSESFLVEEGDEIFVDSLGELVRNPRVNSTKKEIFANSWLYNVSPTFNVVEFSSNNFTISSSLDKSILKKGDPVEIIDRVTNEIFSTGVVNNEIISGNTINVGNLNPSLSYESNKNYGIRKKIRRPSITGTSFESKSVADIQNVYSDGNDFFYVASNSLPSKSEIESPYSYQPNVTIIQIDNLSFIDDLGNDEYASLQSNGGSNIPFLNGDEIVYSPISNPIVGLSAGNYFVEVISNKIRLFNSLSLVGTNSYIKLKEPSGGINSGDKFTLKSQKDNFIGAQKLLKKFPLNTNITDFGDQSTNVGSVGMMINGVEITNYKSNDKVYYGPLESINIANSGENYDVINLPQISVSSGLGNTALIQPVISGSIKDVYIDSQDFDIDKVVSVTVSGGNGKGAVLDAVLSNRSRSVFFDARTTTNSGGINTTGNTLTFLSNHNFDNGEEIIYNNSGNTSLGIGTLESSTLTLINNGRYFAKVLNNKAIQLFETKLDYSSGINTVGFTTANTAGIHQFRTSSVKKTVSEIKVIRGGSGYTNRKLIVSPSDIDTSLNTINFNNHNFNDGDLVEYSYQTSNISGLSTNNQYYILKKDQNSFRLSDAGIGGTIRSNFEKGKYVNLTSSGSGYQYFKYPDITATLSYTNVGLGTTTQEKTITLTPSVRGSIVDTYLYNAGTGYGSSIINLEKSPIITIKNGKDAKLIPNIINGKIDSVTIEYGGKEYYSVPDLNVIDSTGEGRGAKLRAIISNGKITDVKILSVGIGYSTSTSIEVSSAGSNALLDSSIRSLTINNLKRFGKELLSESNDKLQYSVCGYSINYLNIEDATKHSPIIGWAYDGNPIYGPYGYSDPNDITNIISVRSGYVLDTSTIVDRPSTSDFAEGMFVEDYKFTNPSASHLDEYNGRFTKTPEFPNGVYAYFSTIDLQSEPEFPYFIGHKYKSEYILDNNFIDQSFDFGNSNLLRNTFPYNMSDKTSDYDFVEESNELRNQKSIIESVSDGSISKVNIISSGSDYKVNDTIKVDNTGTNGNGLSAKVSFIEGKELVDIVTNTETYNNAIFTWNNSKEVEVTIDPYHNFKNGDSVSISGFTTVSKLNNSFVIGVTSYTSSLETNIPVGTGTTEIHVSEIPPVSIGSSISIGSETLSILNIFKKEKTLTVKRGLTNVGHSTGASITFLSDSFTIPVETNYFNSTVNNKIYFNPIKSIGFGTEVGISTTVSFSFGEKTIIRDIPTQSIYIPNHPFKNNQKLIITNSGDSISVSTTSDGSTFSLPTTVYATNKGKDLIGIKTTLISDEIFFHNSGSDSDEYLLTSNFEQKLGKVEKVTTTVSVSTSHGLSNGDLINLNVQPSLNVGIGTSSSIRLSIDTNSNKLLVNTIGFNSTGINTSTNTININAHNFKTGDKIKYSADLLPLGLSNSEYYIYKIDNDSFKLAETYYDTQLDSPSTIGIGSTGGANQNISLINSQLEVVEGNNLVFDTSDSTLSGYNLKIFADKEFKNEFVSTGSTNSFNIVSTATSTTIYYSDNFPERLYYNLEKSGYISTADTEVKDYNEILYVDSQYNGSYKISGVGNTTFNIIMSRDPEKVSYTKTECNILKYTTTSTSTSGGISKINIVDGGSGYKKMPLVSSFVTSNGKNANIIFESSKVGNSNQVRTVNDIFQYPSDPTLQPSAFVAPLIKTKDSNTIGIVSVTSGGIGYSDPPSIIIVNSTTNQVINSGLLKANLSGSSISNVDINVEPKGLPDSGVTLFATNNTNGISITKVESSSTGIFTCYVTTPTLDSDFRPFTAGDKVFIEGIVKNSTDGSGFNSSDYDYTFLSVDNYITSSIPHKVVINVSGLTTNTGIAKTIQDSFATIINQSDYPTFTTVNQTSNFEEGEQLSSSGFNRDLFVISSSNNTLKVSGNYRHDLSIGEVLRGNNSGNIATIDNININQGKFLTSYSNKKNIGWFDSVGVLNNDSQRIPNNDYYQNLSYSVRSPITYDKQRTPVNELLHTAGLKNFADTELFSSKSVGIGSDDGTSIIVDLISDNRVDTVYQFDFAKDVDISSTGSAKFIKFLKTKLSSYTEIQKNLVYPIDDINSEFSNLKDQENPELFVKLYELNDNDFYTNLLIRVTDSNNSEIQLSDLVILGSSDGYRLLNKVEISNIGSELLHTSETNYGQFSIIEDDFNRNYLIFDPVDPYSKDYNIKVLQKEFYNSSVGIATTSIGTTIDITNSTRLVSSGVTTNIVGVSTNEFKSLVVNAKVKDTISNLTNFVEIVLTNDGTNPYMGESYYDSTGKLFSGENIGSFGSNISNGVMNLEFTNDSTQNNVLINSRIVGFGSTASYSSGTYEFKSEGQANPRNIQYLSNYSHNIIPTGFASTITVFQVSDIFNSAKSIVQVSVGNTVAIHQVMILKDNTGDVYTQQSQILFTDSENSAGMGTFGVDSSAGNVLNLSYYPDTEYSSVENELVSYNEIFYSDIDSVNVSNDLIYGNSLESSKIFSYAGINGDIGNKKQFTLKTNGTPIFAKTFNPSDSTTLNLSTGVFSIDNHFFKNNEELIYTPKSTFIGIGSTPMQYKNGNVIDTLPSTVFAIYSSDNTFQISTTRAGTAVTFVSVGEGNAHQFEMAKKNEKTILTLDNIVQYPLIFTPINQSLGDNGGSISTTATTFALSGISSISSNSIIRVDDEYMKVINVGFGTSNIGPITGIGTTALVTVERAVVGSSATSHNDSGIATVYKGSYNIVGSDLFFIDAPRGDANQDKNIMNLDVPTSNFTGRVYFRSDYSTNQIYDDISDEFTGIGRTFTLTVGGANTASGIGTTDGQNQNALLFLNGLFQTPETDNNPTNNFIITSDTDSGISTVTFSGITIPNSSDIFSSEVDVNRNEVPRGGLIVSLGSTGGLGYAPLVGASVTAVIGVGGIIESIGLGNTDIVGSGYNGSPSGIGVSVFDPDGSGSGAVVSVSSIGVGGTLTFNVDASGSNYSANTKIFVDSPSYQNLNVIGISRLGIGTTTDTGSGLQINVEVGASSTTFGIGSTHFEVKSFDISRQGYSFKKGDKFTPVGLVTDARLSEPLEPFTLEVLDVYTDSFAMWQFGELDYIDSIKIFQDGTRTNFPLFYNEQIRSFEAKDEQVIDFSNHLLVIINGVIQNPGEAYTFDGGTTVDFTTAPKPEDRIDIFFYKGVDGIDTINQANILEFIHRGDSLQIEGFDEVAKQNKRVVYDVSFSDKVETNLYSNQGISTSFRPINLIKQKRDQKINGAFESKVRESIQSQIYPTARIIKDIIPGSPSNIFVDNSEFFKEDVGENNFDLLIVSESSDPVSAAITAVVSAAGTISSLNIIDGGSGYTSSPTIKISAPQSIGIGIGTTATATVTVSAAGTVNGVTISNPGFGYTSSTPPQVIVSSQDINYELVSGLSTSNITGFSGIITGIGTTTSGSNLAIEFNVYSNNNDITDSNKSFVSGTPLYVFDTRVGSGVTSMDVSGVGTVGIGTTFVDNIYYSIGDWSGISGNLGVITCIIHSDTSVVGIASTGTIENPVGRFSWGRISNASISQISIGVTGLTVDAGLTSFPSAQRRGSFGIRYTGSLGK